MGPPVVVTYVAGTTLPPGASGDFDIVFSQVPIIPNPYSFNVRVIDINNVSQDIPTVVTVDPAADGGVTRSNPIQEFVP